MLEGLGRKAWAGGAWAGVYAVELGPGSCPKAYVRRFIPGGLCRKASFALFLDLHAAYGNHAGTEVTGRAGNDIATLFRVVLYKQLLATHILGLIQTSC